MTDRQVCHRHKLKQDSENFDYIYSSQRLNHRLILIFKITYVPLSCQNKKDLINPMTEKLPAKEYLERIKTAFIHMKEILLERFENDNSTIMTNHSQLRENIYRLNHSKATTREKVEVNKYVRNNIQSFIKIYVAKKLTPLDNLSKDPHKFVKTLNEVWTHFQIFIFCHFFACEKLSEFFISFHRMNNVKDYQYPTELNSIQRHEIVPIPTMGVNQLKKYFEEINMIDRFKSIFNQFLLYEREGKNVPRSQIRESVHSLESCYFDMDAYSELEDQKPRLIKKELKNDKLSINRRSKDGEFFEQNLLKDTLDNLGRFYANYVDQKVLVMNSTDEIRKIIEIINEEEARANYYIHSKENRTTYINTLNTNLILRELEKRIMKEDGLKRYLELYEEGKEEYERQLKDFWRVYSRIVQFCLPFVKDIFTKYLLVEAEKVCQKIRIPPEFIQELIRINSKCIKIVDICDNNFELEKERNDKIRDMITNCITQRGKKEAKFDTGAKNLASFINNKFKTSYSKGGLEALGDSYRQLVSLFKIMLEKTRFIDEYHKHLGNRLLEDIEFSKDLETGQILIMEKQFIEEIQKECGVTDVRELTEVIKDIEKSNESNNKLKSKVPADKLFPLNQLIIKNANNWPEKSTYNIENPPSQILKCYNAVSDYFKRDNTNIQFEFNSGVSHFRGDYDNGKKQNFQFKNIHMLILLYIDEEKKIFYGDLKKKIESVGTNRQRGQIDFARSVIELYYSGFITSATKSIKPGTPNICKILETDEFQLNRKYDFVEEEKKKKGGKGPLPKPVPIVKSNILTISQQIKKGFEEEMKAYNDDQKKIEAERKYKVQCITVKTLKHAHHHNMNCSFEQLYKVTQDGKNKEFRVAEKFLKEIVEELIIKRYCERIEGQRNVFRYIA